MQIFLITLLAFTLAVLFMSVGVLMGRKPIAGSCGGMTALGLDTSCAICGGDQSICDAEQEKKAQAGTMDLAYDATREQDKRG